MDLELHIEHTVRDGYDGTTHGSPTVGMSTFGTLMISREIYLIEVTRINILAIIIQTKREPPARLG